MEGDKMLIIRRSQGLSRGRLLLGIMIFLLIFTMLGMGFYYYQLKSHRLTGIAMLDPEVSGVIGAAMSKGEMSFPDLIAVLNRLKAEYVKDVDPHRMLNGAIKGLRLYADHKHLEGPVITYLAPGQSLERDIQALRQRYNEVSRRWSDKAKSSEIFYAALAGMLSILDDPYTMPMRPDDYRQLSEQMSGGNFGGVGIYIEIDKEHGNQLTVTEPIEDTPAFRGGIQPGDRILKIDGVSTKGMDIELAAKRIRGQVGSSVLLTISRNGKQQPFNVSLVRSMIHVPSVVAKMVSPKIGHLKLRVFGTETDQELRDAMAQLRAKGAQALILDLRNNGGGYINAAVDVCSQFLPRGTLVVSVVNYRTREQRSYRSLGGKSNNLPTVVLVNGFSASASEITAGALQDTRRAVLIGTNTFGKGSVQSIYELRDGGAVKYTVANYHTPNGRNINAKEGLTPDIEVKMEPRLVGGPKDVQLQRAIEYLSRKLKATSASGGGES